jgi:uncharacterized membrane protein YjdF
MRLTRSQKVLALVNFAVIAAFAAYYVSIENYEFLWYVCVLVGFFALILFTIHRSQFPLAILGGLSVWGFLHMAGGGIQACGSVLYACVLVPISGSGEATVLKYDQAVHFFGFFMATLVMHHLLSRQLLPDASRFVVYLTILAAGMGLGALNEIVEFAAVLAAPETGVGGYYNTAIDLVFNMLGALAAVALVHFLYNGASYGISSRRLEDRSASPSAERTV